MSRMQEHRADDDTDNYYEQATGHESVGVKYQYQDESRKPLAVVDAEHFKDGIVQEQPTDPETLQLSYVMTTPKTGI